MVGIDFFLRVCYNIYELCFRWGFLLPLRKFLILHRREVVVMDWFIAMVVTPEYIENSRGLKRKK